MMSSEDREILYPLVINQLLHDGYGVFALSLKKILIPNCETVASNKLLKLVKLGLAVSKCILSPLICHFLDLEDSDLSKDFTHIVHAFQPGHPNNSSFFSNSSSSSNNQSIDQSPQQSLQQNGSQGAQFTLGVNQSLKLEPGDHAFNSFHLPLGAYQRQWVQMANRNTINLDGEIHELPGDGSPNKLFECSLCGKVFNRRDKVKRHLSELHHGLCMLYPTCFVATFDTLSTASYLLYIIIHFSAELSLLTYLLILIHELRSDVGGRLPLFTASPPQAKSANQQQSASQQVSPVTVVNTTPVSSSSSPTTPAQVSVASPPATATASTTAAVTSSSSRGMFPIFPVQVQPRGPPVPHRLPILQVLPLRSNRQSPTPPQLPSPPPPWSHPHPPPPPLRDHTLPQWLYYNDYSNNQRTNPINLQRVDIPHADVVVKLTKLSSLSLSHFCTLTCLLCRYLTLRAFLNTDSFTEDPNPIRRFKNLDYYKRGTLCYF
ncbi:hypothetical protein EGR_06065 [Echinococcus granulosus]|uniref:C2H2-type domain-containing protein n=1 Tax=Echinococcus granulosus TaxID=6210 RepID=W6UDI8_ECHGR|nr:hypothetical protein EGR_06065 [Echinococcus granulosus]EUB59073.1 hypothetical protein EGR_06065 [Echinococcus granulosus]